MGFARENWKIPAVLIAGGLFIITALVIESSTVKALEAPCGTKEVSDTEEYEVRVSLQQFFLGMPKVPEVEESEVRVWDPVTGSFKTEVQSRPVIREVPRPCPPRGSCPDECVQTGLPSYCDSGTTFRTCEYVRAAGCTKKGPQSACPTKHDCVAGGCRVRPGPSVGPSYETKGLIRLTVGYGGGKEARPGGVGPTSPLDALIVGQLEPFYVHWEISPISGIGKMPDRCWLRGTEFQGQDASIPRGEKYHGGFSGSAPASYNNGSGYHNFQVLCRWSDLPFIGSIVSESNVVSVQYIYNPVQPPGNKPTATPPTATPPTATECTPCSTLGWSLGTKLCRNTDQWEECILKDGKPCLSTFSCSGSYPGTKCDTDLAGAGRCIGSQPSGGCTSDSQCPSAGGVKQECENGKCVVPPGETPTGGTTVGGTTVGQRCLSHGNPDCGNCDGQCGDTSCSGTCSKNSSIRCNPPSCATPSPSGGGTCTPGQSGSTRPCPAGGNQVCYRQPNGLYEWTACPSKASPKKEFRHGEEGCGACVGECGGKSGTCSENGAPCTTQSCDIPEANITANGQSGIVSVPYNSSARVAWCGSDGHNCRSANRCWVEGGGGGSGTSGSFTTGVASKMVIKLTCSNADGSSQPTDSVTLVPGKPGGGFYQCSDGKDNDGDKKADDGVTINGVYYPPDSGCQDLSGKYKWDDDNESSFNIKEIIPDFFNLKLFQINLSNILSKNLYAQG